MRLRALIRPTAPAAAVLLAFLLLSGCGQNGSAAGTDTTVDPAVAPTPDVLDFAEARNSLDTRLGKKVVVRAMVEGVAAPGVFTLTDRRDTTLDEIVVVDVDAGEVVEAGADVIVTGTVEERFSETGIEEVLGIEMVGDSLDDFDGHPYIVASEVDTAPPEE